MEISDPSAVDTRWLATACLAFAAVGLFAGVGSETAIFQPWRAAAARSLYDADALPADLAPLPA